MKKLTETEEKIAKLIYDKLDYMYCNNCRFNSEISEEKSMELYGNWGCEDCHRKYNGWGISKSEADNIAMQISNIVNG